MARLDDGTPLSCVSIPGAHDAASASITSWSHWTRTQELDLEGLWDAGVRAFDLRLALVDGVLGGYHDKYSANITFQEALETLESALGRNPGEFAIVLVRHEQEADGNNPEWGKVISGQLVTHGQHLASWREGLTVGELRGKILVLSRKRYEGGPIGGFIDGWSHSTEMSAQQSASVTGPDGVRSGLWVQDCFNPDDAASKWDVVRRMLDATAGDEDAHPLVINHASGYLGLIPNYRKLAKEINPATAEYIRESYACPGIIMMDFAGVDVSKGVKVSGGELVRAVVENNRGKNH